MRRSRNVLSPVVTQVGLATRVASTLAFVLLLGLTTQADDADHAVSSESDLRNAITNAADGDTITAHFGATHEFDQPGGDVELEQSVPLATSGLVATAENASADAVYSNLRTFRQQSYAHGGAAQQLFNTITRLAADDLNLVGTPPYSINGYRFTVTNLNAVDVSARMLVRFYHPNGPGGGPGTLIAAYTYNPIVFTAGRVGTIKTSTKFVMPTSSFWAGIGFDNANGSTGATAAQLDNLAQGVFSPAELGTSADQYFVTTAAGSFASDNPAGTLGNFGGAPPADFGWEILTAQDVDLSITKTSGAATAVPGGNVAYTITASNAGPNTVFDARVVDSFPSTLTCSWTCAGSPGNNCAASGSGNINDATVDLAVGGSVTYTANCTVSTVATGTIANTASILAPGTAVESSVLNNSATNVVTLTAMPPAIAKAFATPAILVGGTTMLTFTLTNPNLATALTGVGFTDSLPAGLVVATPNGLTSNCGGTVSALAGSGSMALSSGTLAAGGSCTITAGVTGTASGLKGNVTSAVTSAQSGAGAAATAFLVVVNPATPAPPTIAKSFGAASVVVNGTTSLTFDLTNPNPAGTLSGVGFTDTLPAGLVVATPNGVVGNCGGGTVTAVAGSGSVGFAGGSLPANSNCTITLNVTGVTAGIKNNTTSAVSSTEGGAGGTAAASLTVVGPPTIAKAFGTAGIVLNGTTTLTFSLTNPNPATALSGVGFSDPFPAGLVVSTPNGLASTCGGTVTAVAGSGSVALTGGGLAGNGSCTITLNATGTTAGAKNNTTTGVVSTEGGPGGTASASVTVLAPPTIAKSFGAANIALNGTTSLTISLANPNPATALSGVGFTDLLPAGLLVAAPNGLTSDCGGAVTAVAGSRGVTLANVVLPASGSCTMTVNVMGTSLGPKNNTTGAVTSTEVGPGGTASASVTVIAPPTIAKAFGSLAVLLNGTTPLTFTLTNPNEVITLTGVGFTDTIPAGLSVVNGVSATCGGTATTSGGNTITLAGATIAGSGTCTFAVTVTGTTSGLKPNVTSAVTSIEGGTGGFASAFLVVVDPQVTAPPTIAKAFGAASILLNGTTTLTFTLGNPNPGPGGALSGVTFTDTLPIGLVVATPNGIANTCGGTVAAVAGTGSAGLANVSLPPGGSCTMSVSVTGTTLGAKDNTTSAITSIEGSEAGGTASASLTVVGPPTIAKAFGAASVALNETTTLRFTLTNPNPATALSGVGFTDALPAGLVVATPNGLTGSCGGGTITATPGSASITLAGATLDAATPCEFEVGVLAVSAGTLVNTTSVPTSSNGGAGIAATASIIVEEPAAAIAQIPTLSTTALAVLAMLMLLIGVRRLYGA
ncbi:MAG: hypothetical protein WC538_22910 [Thermoanaerobaculia bacterium]|jgi:uncharacterized repeat protein (TIGR01451 family)